MLTTLCAMTALLTSGQEFTYERLNLDNGSAIIVQSLPDAKTISVQLFASARGVQETPATHGWRHLLEHILAKGQDKTLDSRIETKGMFMTAETHREAMQFEVRAIPSQAQEAVTTLGEFLKPPKLTQEEIDKEVKILGQELAIQTNSSKLSQAAWLSGYGEPGLDPLGDVPTMAKATPEAINALYQKHFNPANIVVSIAGPIGTKEGIAMARKILEPLKGTPAADWVRRADGKPARGDADSARGSARCALVQAYSEPETAWTIAAAFGVATEFEDSFFIYTPTIQNGLVVVGNTKDKEFGRRVDRLDSAEALGLFRQGKINAQAWVRNRLNNPSGAAFLRGYLGCQALGARPEYLLENLDALTPIQFARGFEKLKAENAVEVIGGRL